MDALNEWNSLTPGQYTVDFMNGKIELIPIERFITNYNGGVVYMLDTYGGVYNWANVLKLTKIADL